MKNKAILKKKRMEISLYTSNIFHLGQDVMFTKHMFTFKTNEKVLLYLLRSKKLNIK